MPPKKAAALPLPKKPTAKKLKPIKCDPKGKPNTRPTAEQARRLPQVKPDFANINPPFGANSLNAQGQVTVRTHCRRAARAPANKVVEYTRAYYPGKREAKKIEAASTAKLHALLDNELLL